MHQLKQIARVPAVVTAPDATVLELSRRMRDEHVGAMAVVEDGRLIGIVSERDVVTRAVAAGKSPETMLVADIMTTKLRTASPTMQADEALEVMQSAHIRHLPLVDDDGSLVGMLSVRHLLRSRMLEMGQMNSDLVNFISIDGPGG